MPIADITLHFLELERDSFQARALGRDDVTFARVNPPIPELNRFFYLAVGAPWYWLERRPWTYDAWRTHLDRGDAVETWVLSERGVPAGYVELERRDNGAVEIKYFGLLSAFFGRGLGAHLLTCAVERAFAMGATKVVLDTCTLDHPHALSNYLARGFREVRTEVKQKELPDAVPGPWERADESDHARALLRHAVAVVAYRGGKVLRDAPAAFGAFSAGGGCRTAVQILAHIGDLYAWAVWLARGEHRWDDRAPDTWEREVDRFFVVLADFDAHLASAAPMHWSAERLMAGPVADSLTHIGQLAMLRRLAGAPVRGENYAKADIAAGRVGAEQSVPVREFD